MNDTMPGMNRNSRTILLIEAAFQRLDRAAALAPGRADAAAVESAALDAIGLLDELRRLERKWRQQVADGGGRRKPADFRSLDAWYRQWVLLARPLLDHGASGDLIARLRGLVAEVETSARRG